MANPPCHPSEVLRCRDARQVRVGTMSSPHSLPLSSSFPVSRLALQCPALRPTPLLHSSHLPHTLIFSLGWYCVSFFNCLRGTLLLFLFRVSGFVVVSYLSVASCPVYQRRGTKIKPSSTSTTTCTANCDNW